VQVPNCPESSDVKLVNDWCAEHPGDLKLLGKAELCHHLRDRICHRVQNSTRID
jgi:hypothetical protein